jgi:hypothetical protein
MPTLFTFSVNATFVDAGIGTFKAYVRILHCTILAHTFRLSKFAKKGRASSARPLEVGQ